MIIVIEAKRCYMGYMFRNLEDGVLFIPEPTGVLHSSLQSLVLNQYLLTPKETFRKDSRATIRSTSSSRPIIFAEKQRNKSETV